MGRRSDARQGETARERESLLIEARDLIASGRFDEAEAMVRERDGSLETAAMLAKVYRECLRTAVATEAPRPLIGLMFDRAKEAVCRAWPEPHTPIEAEQYERGRSEDKAALERIVSTTVGWRP
jgi:hypothetical protein